ncbi:hypothetical protein HZS_4141 [Henneguya salminicola]|nr:hypothetical protein HZS_4141 [Henneguya salminicola]
MLILVPNLLRTKLNPDVEESIQEELKEHIRHGNKNQQTIEIQTLNEKNNKVLTAYHSFLEYTPDIKIRINSKKDKKICEANESKIRYLLDFMQHGKK